MSTEINGISWLLPKFNNLPNKSFKIEIQEEKKTYYYIRLIEIKESKTIARKTIRDIDLTALRCIWKGPANSKIDGEARLFIDEKKYVYVGTLPIKKDILLYVQKKDIPTKIQNKPYPNYHITQIPCLKETPPDSNQFKLSWEKNGDIEAIPTSKIEQGLIRISKKGGVQKKEEIIPLPPSLVTKIDANLLYSSVSILYSTNKILEEKFYLKFYSEETLSTTAQSTLQLPSTLQSVAAALDYLRNSQISTDSNGTPHLVLSADFQVSSDLGSAYPSAFTSSALPPPITPNNDLPPLQFPFKKDIIELKWTETTFNRFKISINKVQSTNNWTVKLMHKNSGSCFICRSLPNLLLEDYLCVWKGPVDIGTGGETRLFINLNTKEYLYIGVYLDDNGGPQLYCSLRSLPSDYHINKIPYLTHAKTIRPKLNWREAKKTEKSTLSALEGLEQTISTRRIVEIIKVLPGIENESGTLLLRHKLIKNLYNQEEKIIKENFYTQSVHSMNELPPTPLPSNITSITEALDYLENHKTSLKKTSYDTSVFALQSLPEFSENWMQESLGMQFKLSSTPDGDLNELEPLELEDLDSLFS